MPNVGLQQFGCSLVRSVQVLPSGIRFFSQTLWPVSIRRSLRLLDSECLRVIEHVIKQPNQAVQRMSASGVIRNGWRFGGAHR